MDFYVGLHIPAHLHRFERCMVSLNVLEGRVSDVEPNDWLLDSGAFTEIKKYGRYRRGVQKHARMVERWAGCGNLRSAACADWPCDEDVLSVTGLTVREHQKRTIQNYLDLRCRVDDAIHVMPVLQGNCPWHYVEHLQMYGDLLAPGAYVGMGSLVGVSDRPGEVLARIGPVRHRRPDLRVHGFGLGLAALASPAVWHSFETADTMAWSWAARRAGRNQNAPEEAKQYVRRVGALRRPRPDRLDQQAAALDDQLCWRQGNLF